MNTPPDLRLHLFHAAQAERSVILRQGPNRLWRMIAWDRRDDTFTLGEWVRLKIYPERCALSPDGAHFLWFGLDGQWDRPAKGAYTAISRPPAFKPVALFPQGDTWGGGGYWVDHKRFVVQSGVATEDILGEAQGLIRVDAEIRRAILPRGIRRRATLDEPPEAPDLPYTTEGARLLDANGQIIADFTEMEPPA